MNYFIDFEAASPITEIISIGCVREDGKEFYSLVKPAEAIVSEKITELTGITSAMLESAPSAIEVFTDFYNFANIPFALYLLILFHSLICIFLHLEKINM